jgi:hypothetical protein
MHAHMQGNCASKPSSSALGLSGNDLSLHNPGQCVVVTDVYLMTLQHEMWLDNLYIRRRSSDRTSKAGLFGCFGKFCKLWLTSVTFLGDTAQRLAGGALDVAGGQVYAEGVHAADSLHTI